MQIYQTCKQYKATKIYNRNEDTHISWNNLTHDPLHKSKEIISLMKEAATRGFL